MTLLAVDVGNTNVVIGLFEGERIVQRWRVETQPRATEDEIDVLLVGLLARRSVDLTSIGAGCLSSTVPAAVQPWSRALRRLSTSEPVVLGPGIRTGMAVHTDNPREVGADRIANSVAAQAFYGAPVIVVDFGTSTNFDVVSGAGEFIGGVLAPGIEVSMEALYARAARLGTVELVAPQTVIGRSTVTALQSGAIYGFAGQIDAIVRRIQGELGAVCPVVATGGLAELVVPHAETVTEHNHDLTLHGLRLIHERN